MAIRSRLREQVKPLLGLAFIVVLVLMAWGSVLSFNKELPWQDTVAVTLTTTSAGLGLSPPSDVKIQGLRVGEVREVTSDGRSAVLHIALDPARIDLIPENIDAAIIPKTLFGEKYVDLRLPERPSVRHIAAGGQISQSQTSVEIGRLFTSLAAMLDTLKPEQLSLTLNSVADALQGNGENVGETLELLHTYLSRFNPHLDKLTDNFAKVAEVSDVYTGAADDLVRVLDNSRAISAELLAPKERSFESFLEHTIEASDETADMLTANGRELVTLAGRQRPVLEVLATYAEELPCLADSLVKLNRAANRALGGYGPYLKASIDVLVDHESYSYPEDAPSNPDSDANENNLPPGITSWAPHCPYVPERFNQLADHPAYNADGAATKPRPAAAERSGTAERSTRAQPSSLGTAIAARLMHRPAADVPPLAGLMLSPLMRGGEVSMP